MEKTLAPTPRRLRRALQEGDSPISLLAVRAGALLAFALLLPAAAGALQARFQELLRRAVASPESADPLQLASDVTLLAGPVLGALAVTALGLGLVQTGFIVSFGRTAPRLRRLGPGALLRALGGRAGLHDAARTLGIGLVLALVAGYTLVTAGASLASATSLETSGLEVAGATLARLLRLSVLTLLAFAALDIAVKRGAWRRRWRMSPRDVADERRESEGDPDIKRARRRAHEGLERAAEPAPGAESRS